MKTKKRNQILKRSQPETLFIYTRTAVDNAAADSLRRQEFAGKLMAKAMGMKAVFCNEGIKQGDLDSFISTPLLGDLLYKTMRGEVKHLYVFDISRLSRNRGILQYALHVLNENKVTIYTADGIYDRKEENDYLIESLKIFSNQLTL